MLVKLLRHGILFTGGARYESELLARISKLLKASGQEVDTETAWEKKLFNGINNVDLIEWAFTQSNADVNIVVARAALSALIRNFRGNKVLIVLHYFDERDEKGVLLKWYYKALFSYLKLVNPSNAGLIVVSPFFENYFKSLFPKMPIFMIPNTFDISKYQVTSVKNRKKIFLGQWSAKNDEVIFELAKKLTNAGYYCFFASLNPEDVKVYDDYEIINVDFQKYLEEMASALCTISFTKINEGWSRVTHESLMVGTPVIGFERGGLGDLLKLSGSNIVNSIEEAFNLISHPEQLKLPNNEFLSNYDIQNADKYYEPLIRFIKEK